MSDWIPTTCSCCHINTAYKIANAVRPHGSNITNRIRCDACRHQCSPHATHCERIAPHHDSNTYADSVPDYPGFNLPPTYGWDA